VSNQGTNHRGGETEVAFLKIYNEENVINRTLPTLEQTSKDDIIIKDNPTFSISLLRNFLQEQEIKLVDVS